MKSEWIDIKTADGVCDAFIAHPDDGAAHPAVLFYMDAFGPRPWLYEMAKKIAARGYYVLLPNVFYRVRRAPVVDAKFPLRPEDMAEVRKLFGPLFQSFTPAMGMKDAETYLDFLAAQSLVKSAKIGVTGYCMGEVWRFAPPHTLPPASWRRQHFTPEAWPPINPTARICSWARSPPSFTSLTPTTTSPCRPNRLNV